MAALKAHKTVKGGLGGSVEYYEFIYDFAVDAGGTGALDIMTASGSLLVVFAAVTVITVFSTGSSPTLIWGHTDDTDCFMNVTQGAAANLIAGACIVPPLLEGTPNVAATPLVLTTGKKLLQTIGTAAFTTGKCMYRVGVMRV